MTGSLFWKTPQPTAAPSPFRRIGGCGSGSGVWPTEDHCPVADDEPATAAEAFDRCMQRFLAAGPPPRPTLADLVDGDPEAAAGDVDDVEMETD